jgi:hypothetical protein
MPDDDNQIRRYANDNGVSLNSAVLLAERRCVCTNSEAATAAHAATGKDRRIEVPAFVSPDLLIFYYG